MANFCFGELFFRPQNGGRKKEFNLIIFLPFVIGAELYDVDALVDALRSLVAAELPVVLFVL